MLNCKRATELLSEAQERELTFAERASLKMHTMMCSGCDNFGKQMVTLRVMSKTYASNKKIDEYLDKKED